MDFFLKKEINLNFIQRSCHIEYLQYQICTYNEISFKIKYFIFTSKKLILK